MTIEELEKILELSWSKETSCCDEYSEDNKSFGQCDVTALVVNDFIGGKIIRCFTEECIHYINIVGNNIIDLTKNQFVVEPYYDYVTIIDRNDLLMNNNNRKRYQILLKNIQNSIIKLNMEDCLLLKK